MGVFEMIVAIVLISTAGKIILRTSSPPRGGGSTLTGERAKELAGQLESTELRLAQAEDKIVRLEEKLHFVESLLAPPDSPARLHGERGENR